MIYHHPCHDGFTAAWIAHSALAGQCDLHPAQYGDPLPDVTGRDVLVFDFSYPRETMIAAHQVARSFRVFDHHKTAAEACRDLQRGDAAGLTDGCLPSKRSEETQSTDDDPE